MTFLKKNKLLIVGGLCVVALIAFALIYDASRPKERFIESYLDVFDTATQIVGYADKPEELKEKADVLHEKLVYYHKLFDIYHSYEGTNNLRTINLKAGVEPVKVDRAIIDLLKFSINLYDLTDGQTNIAMGKMLSIWHDYRTHGIDYPDEATLPSLDELKEAHKHSDITKIIIDEEASTVYLADPDMSLDVGSIGKGYAVQKVADYARELGYTNIAISVGGNIASIGSAIDEKPWRFGIESPFKDETQPWVTELIAKVDIHDLCLVTSGDYQRYYVVGDKTYCHIIDPDTLMPADYFRSVTILINDSAMADALSTALFNMTYEEGLELINSIENAEAMWIFGDGTIKYSEGFEKYVVQE